MFVVVVVSAHRWMHVPRPAMKVSPTLGRSAEIGNLFDARGSGAARWMGCATDRPVGSRSPPLDTETPRHGSKDAFFSREATESDWARRKAVKLSGPDRLRRCGSGVRSMTRRRHELGIMFGLDERDNASSGWGNCGCGSGGGNLPGDGGVWIGQARVNRTGKSLTLRR